MIADIIINFIAAIIGALLIKSYYFVRQLYIKKCSAWFWVPIKSTKITIFFGHRRNLALSTGEIEPMITIPSAFALWELKKILCSYYKNVVTTYDEIEIDWESSVISLGGPIINQLTKQIGEADLLPLWFLDMPYSKDSIRIIGGLKRTEAFRSEFNENNNKLISDVGFVARIRAPNNPDNFLYIIAGNYGLGNLGVVKYLKNPKKLAKIKDKSRSKFFQVLIRAYISKENIVCVKQEMYKEIE